MVWWDLTLEPGLLMLYREMRGWYWALIRSTALNIKFSLLIRIDAAVFESSD